MYQLFQAAEDYMAPFRQSALFAAQALHTYFDLPGAAGIPARSMIAASDMIGHGAITHRRPAFHLPTMALRNIQFGNPVANRKRAQPCLNEVDGDTIIPIAERRIMETPFGALLHFEKQWPTALDPHVATHPQQQVLIVTPMSGHFSTLLRDTIATMLPDFDVFITDWTNARDVDLAFGAFGFDDYVHHLIAFMEGMQPGSHVVAVCQPAVQALCATIMMEISDHPALPASLTLIAGPLDTQAPASEVDRLAQSHDLGWFRKNMIHQVPYRYRGAGRLVYPGYLQIASFISMNANRHAFAALNQMKDIIFDHPDAIKARRGFYEEYFAVMDMPAEFYLETVERVFQNNDLASGHLRVDGIDINPAALRRSRLTIIEGEMDDICPPGQTASIIPKCVSLHPSMLTHHIQAGVGHYGCFSGSKWRQSIYPIIREQIQKSSINQPKI